MSVLDLLRRLRRQPPNSVGRNDEGGVSSEGSSATQPDHVPGERTTAAVHRDRSVASRLTHFLAMGLMGALALGFLGYYYIHSYANRDLAARAAQKKTQDQAERELPLPPLGPIELEPIGPAVGLPSASTVETVLGPKPPDPPPMGGSTTSPPRSAQRTHPRAAGGGAHSAKTGTRNLLERKIAGPAFSRQPESDARAAPNGPPNRIGEPSPRASYEMSSLTPPTGASPTSAPSVTGRSGLNSLLTPTATPAVSAKVLPTQTLLLPKGAFIDCTLETAIDSSLPGMPTCITATDTFSADGRVVLLERGTKLIGESVGAVQRGSSRLFVLWTEARTPTGVVVPLASPGTDELGRAGLPGEVNRHFWERFGAAILISVIDGAVQAATQSEGSTVILNPSRSEDIATEVLKSTLDIQPTITKRNGDRIQIVVARDLDFRSVYELKFRPAAVDAR